MTFGDQESATAVRKPVALLEVARKSVSSQYAVHEKRDKTRDTDLLRLSVRPSVCPSWYCVEMNAYIVKHLHHLVGSSFPLSGLNRRYKVLFCDGGAYLWSVAVESRITLSMC